MLAQVRLVTSPYYIDCVVACVERSRLDPVAQCVVGVKNLIKPAIGQRTLYSHIVIHLSHRIISIVTG